MLNALKVNIYAQCVISAICGSNLSYFIRESVIPIFKNFVVKHPHLTIMHQVFTVSLDYKACLTPF